MLSAKSHQQTLKSDLKIRSMLHLFKKKKETLIQPDDRCLLHNGLIIRC